MWNKLAMFVSFLDYIIEMSDPVQRQGDTQYQSFRDDLLLISINNETWTIHNLLKVLRHLIYLCSTCEPKDIPKHTTEHSPDSQIQNNNKNKKNLSCHPLDQKFSAIDEFFCENNRENWVQNFKRNDDGNIRPILSTILQNVKTMKDIRFSLFFLILLYITVNKNCKRAILKKNTWCEQNNIKDCSEDRATTFIGNLECIMEMYLGIDYDTLVWERYNITEINNTKDIVQERFLDPAKTLRLYKKNNIIKVIVSKINAKGPHSPELDINSINERAFDCYYKNIIKTDEHFVFFVSECWKRKCSVEVIVNEYLNVISDITELTSESNHKERNYSFYVTEMGIGYKETIEKQLDNTEVTTPYISQHEIDYIGNITISWI